MTKRSDEDWQWLQGEVHAEAKAFAAQLRTVADGGVKVPNLEWSVAELAAHVLCLPDIYKRQNELAEPFEPPTSWPEFSRQARSHITETEPRAQADMLEAAMEQMFVELGDDPNAPRTLYGMEITAYKTAAGVLGELLMHGQDLAALTGASVKMNRRQANAIVSQMMTLTPAFVDREKARKCPGTFHLKFRGGDDYTFRVDDGLLTVEEGRPDSADAHMLADPAAFVLVSMERMSQVKAGLLGKIIAYGRKPWLLIALGKVRIDGV